MATAKKPDIPYWAKTPVETNVRVLRELVLRGYGAALYGRLADHEKIALAAVILYLYDSQSQTPSGHPQGLSIVTRQPLTVSGMSSRRPSNEHAHAGTVEI